MAFTYIADLLFGMQIRKRRSFCLYLVSGNGVLQGDSASRMEMKAATHTEPGINVCFLILPY